MMIAMALGVVVGGWHLLNGTSRDYVVETRGNSAVIRRASEKKTYVGAYGDAGYAVAFVDPAPLRGKRILVTQRAGRGDGSGLATAYVSVWGREGLLTGDARRDLGPRASANAFVLDVPADATAIEFGLMLSGRGEAFVEGTDVAIAGPQVAPTARPLVVAIDAASRERVRSALRARAYAFAPRHDDAFAAVARATRHARIIGFGTSSHGSGAEDERAAELFRYLAAHAGLRVLAVESVFGEARAFDAYVNGERVDIDRALNVTNFYAFETVEFRRLLEWMRSQNAVRPPGRRLHVAGADMEYWWPQSRFVRRQLRARSAVAAADAKRQYSCLAKVIAETALACLNSAREVTASVRREFGGGGIDELHAARMVEQWLERLTSMKTRDDALAENVAWIADTRYPGARVAVWAHLYHVGGACCMGHSSMGQRLAERYHSGYYAIGLIFGGGSVRAIPDGEVEPREVPMPTPSPNVLESILDAVGPDYFVDLDAPNFERSAQTWLEQPHRLRRTDLWTDAHRPETAWTDERFWAAVDGFVYLRTTAAPRLIPRARTRAYVVP